MVIILIMIIMIMAIIMNIIIIMVIMIIKMMIKYDLAIVIIKRLAMIIQWDFDYINFDYLIND